MIGTGDAPFDGWALPSVPGLFEAGVAEARVDPGGGLLRYPRWTRRALEGLCDRLTAGRESLNARVEPPGGADALSVAAALGRVGARFLDPDDPLRRTALALLPSHAGLSPEMAAAVLDGMARDWTRARLEGLLRSELGDPGVLDGFRPPPWTDGNRSDGRRVRAVGPDLCLQICAGTVPGVSVTAMIRSLLVKSAVILKPGRSDVILPVLFARGLREESEALADRVAVVYWPGDGADADTVSPDDVMLERADAVVVYGSDDVVASYRSRTSVRSRFVGYRHRIGVVLVGLERLDDLSTARSVANDVGEAVAAYDQHGCVSPRQIYVEEGASVSPEEWADLLADVLAELEARLPSGPLLPSEGSEIQQLRATGEMRSAAGEEVRIRHGGRAPWTVLLEPEEGFTVSCTGRVVTVRPVSDLQRAVEEMAEIGAYLQTVAVEVAAERREPLAEELARLGAVRVTSAREAPWPPPWWHHDGQGPLQVLLRWVDLEVC